MHTPVRARRSASLGLTALMIASLLVPAPAMAAGATSAFDTGVVSDFDARTGHVNPSSAQVSAVNALGAKVTWNKFGTPASLIKYGGFLATGLGGATAADAARSWLGAHKSIFKLNNVDASSLELVSDITLVRSTGHAVLFRQRFGGLPAAQDGMVTLGLVGTSGSWKLAYVSSTLAGSQSAPVGASISATAAWLAAAHDAGRKNATAVHTTNAPSTAIGAIG